MWFSLFKARSPISPCVLTRVNTPVSFLLPVMLPLPRTLSHQLTCTDLRVHVRVLRVKSTWFTFLARTPAIDRNIGLELARPTRFHLGTGQKRNRKQKKMKKESERKKKCFFFHQWFIYWMNSNQPNEKFHDLFASRLKSLSLFLSLSLSLTLSLFLSLSPSVSIPFLSLCLCPCVFVLSLLLQCMIGRLRSYLNPPSQTLHFFLHCLFRDFLCVFRVYCLTRIV